MQFKISKTYFFILTSKILLTNFSVERMAGDWLRLKKFSRRKITSYVKSVIGVESDIGNVSSRIYHTYDGIIYDTYFQKTRLGPNFNPLPNLEESYACHQLKKKKRKCNLKTIFLGAVSGCNEAGKFKSPEGISRTSY